MKHKRIHCRVQGGRIRDTYKEWIVYIYDYSITGEYRGKRAFLIYFN